MLSSIGASSPPRMDIKAGCILADTLGFDMTASSPANRSVNSAVRVRVSLFILNCD